MTYHITAFNNERNMLIVAEARVMNSETARDAVIAAWTAEGHFVTWRGEE